jgi:DNA-binding CsgD family transcriptional regulator
MPSGRLLHREDELRVVCDAFAKLRAGQAARLIIEGPRGIGKTALLDAALAQRPDDVTVLRARGYDSERGIVFGVAGQLLDALPGASGPPAEDARGAFDAVRAAAAERPLIIAIDDFADADEASRDFIGYLARRLDGLPIALLLTVDSDASPVGVDGPATVLRPAPLCDTCVAEHAAIRFGAPVDTELAAASHVLSQGNPLILDELIDRLQAAGVSPGAPDLDVVIEVAASTLSDTALAWLQQREPIAVELLTNLALLGDGHDLEAAALLSGQGELIADHARAELRRVGLLAPDAPDRCRDELIRAAILTRLAPQRRLDLHAAAARLLVRLGAPARQVADHLMSVGPSDQDWTVPVLRSAARDAVAEAAWSSAARYLREALAETADPMLVAALTAELGAVEMHHDVAAAARYAVTVAAAEAGVVDRASVLVPFANPVLALNASAGFVEVAAELAVTPSAPRELLLRLTAQSLLTGHRAGVRRAMRIVAGGDADDAATRDFLGALAVVGAATGRHRRSALRLAGRSGGPVAAAALSWGEQFDEASVLAAAAVDAARAASRPAERALALLVRGDIEYRTGRLAASLRDARQALQLSRQVSAAGLYAAAVASAARVLLDRGELADAVALLDRIELPATLHPLLRGQILDTQGLAALAAGRPQDAIALFLECGHQLAARGIAGPACVPWRTHAVLAHAAAGETSAARTIAAADVALARTWGAPGALGAALAAMSTCAPDVGERRERVDEAVALLEGAGRPLELARALQCSASAHRDAGDALAARSAERRGVELARTCGAVTPAAQPAEALPAAVIAPAAAGVPQRSPSPRLTSGERRVVELVRRGLSNHAVAEELCLSKRTVDTHLGRVYRKLGIRGRIDLAAALDALPD